MISADMKGRIARLFCTGINLRRFAERRSLRDSNPIAAYTHLSNCKASHNLSEYAPRVSILHTQSMAVDLASLAFATLSTRAAPAAVGIHRGARRIAASAHLPAQSYGRDRHPWPILADHVYP